MRKSSSLAVRRSGRAGTGLRATLIAGTLATLLLLTSFGTIAVAVDDIADPGFSQALQTRLTSVAPGAALNVRAMQNFYADRAYRPLWMSAQGPTPAAWALTQVLAAADEEGLDPTRYGATEALLRQTNAATGPAARAELELQFTDSMLRYTRELAAGMVEPARLDGEHALQPEVPDPAAVLAGAIHADDIREYLRGFAPQRAEYRRLLAALVRYRQIAVAGGWPILPDGPVLKPGDGDARASLLAEHLSATGDLPAGTAGQDGIYSQALADAVRRFQARHALSADGIVGPATRAELNVPVEQRIRVLLINLERRRWMPHVLGERYLFVNLADFTVRAVVADQPVFKGRLVVGATFARTPVFTARMTYLEFNPEWAVPPRIAAREFLPKIRKDPSWLTRNHYVLLSGWQDGGTAVDPLTVDWSRVTAARFPFHLRQASGDDNALGRVKFMFPNPFDVYLHDTPAKALFARPVRAASHGCMRVENPLALAEQILSMAGNAEWNRDAIDSTVAAGTRRVVMLRQPLPVYVGYATAFVDTAGELQFRPDVYGRDRILGAALLAAHRLASR